MEPSQQFSFEDGQQWLFQGWYLLKNFFGLLLLVLLFLGLCYSQLIQMPEWLFFVLVGLFSPIVTAGLSNACYVAKRVGVGGRLVHITDFLAGFKKNMVVLLQLGLVLAVFSLTTQWITNIALDQLGIDLSDDLPMEALLKNTLMAQVISTVISIPLLVLTIFAPQLVFFHNQDLLGALKSSYYGFIAAWRALLMMGLLIVAVVFVVALIGSYFAMLTKDLASLLAIAGFILIFATNICAQFIAFDALFPIDSENQDTQVHEII